MHLFRFPFRPRDNRNFLASQKFRQFCCVRLSYHQLRQLASVVAVAITVSPRDKASSLCGLAAQRSSRLITRHGQPHRQNRGCDRGKSRDRKVIAQMYLRSACQTLLVRYQLLEYREVAKDLASQGATVVLACRNLDAARSCASDIR